MSNNDGANKGQGVSGGKLNVPSNIPPDASGSMFGEKVQVSSMNDSEEKKESGIGGDYSGSNKSSFVL